MKKLSPLKLIVNNKNIEKRSLDDYFQLKDTSMLEEVFNKLKMHFNANLDNEIHPWEFEKNEAEIDAAQKEGRIDFEA